MQKVIQLKKELAISIEIASLENFSNIFYLLSTTFIKCQPNFVPTGSEI